MHAVSVAGSLFEAPATASSCGLDPRRSATDRPGASQPPRSRVRTHGAARVGRRGGPTPRLPPTCGGPPSVRTAPRRTSTSSTARGPSGAAGLVQGGVAGGLEPGRRPGLPAPRRGRRRAAGPSRSPSTACTRTPWSPRTPVPAQADLTDRLAALLPLPGQVPCPCRGTSGLLMDGGGEAEMLALDERDGVEHRWTSASSRVGRPRPGRPGVRGRPGARRAAFRRRTRRPGATRGRGGPLRRAVRRRGRRQRGTSAPALRGGPGGRGAVSGGQPGARHGRCGPREPVSAAPPAGRRRAAARPDRTVTEERRRATSRWPHPAWPSPACRGQPGPPPRPPLVPTYPPPSRSPWSRASTAPATVGGWSEAWTPAPVPDRGLLAAVRGAPDHRPADRPGGVRPRAGLPRVRSGDRFPERAGRTRRSASTSLCDATSTRSRRADGAAGPSAGRSGPPR